MKCKSYEKERRKLKRKMVKEGKIFCFNVTMKSTSRGQITHVLEFVRATSKLGISILICLCMFFFF